MFVREHVALLLCCHDFAKGNAIDFYAQLRLKIDLGTCGTPFAFTYFRGLKRHRPLRTTAFKDSFRNMWHSFCVVMILAKGTP